MNLSVAISTHPYRSEMCRQLVNKLSMDMDFGDYELRVCIDEFSEGIWPNARRAWENYSPEATHHMVLEDDVMPGKDLISGVELALNYLDDGSVISLFSARENIKEAEEQGFSWIKLSRSTGQGLVAPVELIDDWLAWSDRNVRPKAPAADTRWEIYGIAHKMPFFHTVPTLIEHIGANDRVLSKASGNRPIGHTVGRSPCFLGEDKSCKEIDWSKGVLDATDSVSKSRQRYRSYERLLYAKKGREGLKNEGIRETTGRDRKGVRRV